MERTSRVLQTLLPALTEAHQAVGAELHVAVGLDVLQVLLELGALRVLRTLGPFRLLAPCPAEKAVVPVLLGVVVILHPFPAPSAH